MTALLSTAVAPWPTALTAPEVAAALCTTARAALEDAIGYPLLPEADVEVTWSSNRVQVCLDGFCVELGASSRQLSLEQCILNAAVALGESLVGF